MTEPREVRRSRPDEPGKHAGRQGATGSPPSEASDHAAGEEGLSG